MTISSMTNDGRMTEAHLILGPAPTATEIYRHPGLADPTHPRVPQYRRQEGWRRS
jgi:hypothetical protein